MTESSGHFSEYTPWFRKRQDLLERYCYRGKGENPGMHKLSVTSYINKQRTWREEFRTFAQDAHLERGNEYAAPIFNALFGDGALFEFNGNIRNFGLIDNLPPGCCVEVPIVAGKAGLRPVHVGALPNEVAVMTGVNAQCEELAAEGALSGDLRKIYAACYHDPLTAAALGLDEIREMVRLMFAENREFLPQFPSIS